MKERTTDNVRCISIKNRASREARTIMQSIFLSEEEERQFFRDAKKFVGTQERLGQRG